LHEQLRINLEAASQHYKQQANKLHLQPPSFNIGDSVWLDACKIQTTRPTPKLSERKLCPFKIKSVVSKNVFKLSLPLKWKAIHPVLKEKMSQCPSPMCIKYSLNPQKQTLPCWTRVVLEGAAGGKMGRRSAKGVRRLRSRGPEEQGIQGCGNSMG
ncbi:uncharacterized protein VP01_13284g1, partial [Puccinia sorghi]